MLPEPEVEPEPELVEPPDEPDPVVELLEPCFLRSDELPLVEPVPLLPLPLPLPVVLPALVPLLPLLLPPDVPPLVEPEPLLMPELPLPPVPPEPDWAWDKAAALATTAARVQRIKEEVCMVICLESR